MASAVDMVAAGGTPVGGASALMSSAVSATFGPVAVDLHAVLDATISEQSVGAGTTLADLASSPVIGELWPALAAAARATATPQIRQVATIGGTIAAPLHVSDTTVALVAHDTEIDFLVSDEGRPQPVSMPLQTYLSHRPRRPHVITSITIGLPRHRAASRRFRPTPGPGVALVAATGVIVNEQQEIWVSAQGLGPAPLKVSGTDSAPRPPHGGVQASRDYVTAMIALLLDEIREELSA